MAKRNRATRAVVVAYLACVILIAVAAQAPADTWNATQLYFRPHDGTPIDMTKYVLLTPEWTYSVQTGLYRYTYTLDNFTYGNDPLGTGDYIDHFVLSFSNTRNVDVQGQICPDNWSMDTYLFPRTGAPLYLEFKWDHSLGSDDPNYLSTTLAPGGSKVFGFYSSLGPSDVQLATKASSGRAFSGSTYGPLQAPATISTPVPDSPALILGLLGILSIGAMKFRAVKRSI